MLRINVTTAEAVITETELITSGRKGLRCAFTFSDDWAGLAKTVIVQGAATRDIALLATNEITVPAECVNKAQFPLKIGVYGARADGTIAIPTIWASFGKILPGVKPSDIPPDELTPDVVAQIQEAANNALYLARNVQSMADSGEFDGSGVWYTTGRVSGDDNPFVLRRDLIGRQGATVQVHDLLFAPDVRDEGEPTTLYEITSVGTACALKRLCKMQGEDGTSPSVTITEITGGHRITITDEAHPDGQSFDVMDGQGGSGTVDDDFSDTSENPVQNKVITNALYQASAQLRNLGLALDDKVDKVNGKGLSSNDFTDSDKDALDSAASKTWVQQQGYLTGEDLTDYRTAAQQNIIDDAQDAAIAAKYTKPSGGIPKSDLASAVQTSLGKADTALQTAPVTSVNGQTGAVTVPEPFFVTYSTSDMTTWTCDKTFAQITAAMVAGKQVVMIGSVGGTPIAQSCDTLLADYGTRLDFWIRYGRNGWYHIIHNDDDSIEFYNAYIDSQDLDAVASNQGTSEAGKFLVVDSNGYVTTMTLSTWQGGNYGS